MDPRRRRLRVQLLGLALALVLPLAVRAEAADPPIGSTVQVANTDGQRLNLRELPSLASTVIERVDEGTALEVAGPSREADGIRWVNVRAPGGKLGWAANEFLTIVATPTPPATAAPPTSTPAPAAPATPTPAPTAAPTPTPVPEGPLDVEVRVKSPETSDREQTLTVTVTRGGGPVQGAQVVAVTQDTDPPLVREFDATDEQGRSVKSFDIRREKGTVVMVVIAVAPDGAKGHKSVSYFRR